MEAGQLLHNNPVGYETPDFVDALLTHIRSEISRVYWNVNQKPWRGAGAGMIGGGESWWSTEHPPTYDPGIPGFEWRDYYNWGGAPEDPDWDQEEADKPNFAFEGVEVRWYKYFGRSMNVNVVWSAEKWQRWFERAMQTIRAYESHNESFWIGDTIPYPDPSERVPMTITPEDLRYVKLMKQVDLP